MGDRQLRRLVGDVLALADEAEAQSGSADLFRLGWTLKKAGADK